MQPPIGCECQTSFLGDGDKITQMPQFHNFCAMPAKYGLDHTKSFSEPPGEPKSPASASILAMRASSRLCAISALAGRPGVSAP
jgi:hypothetical protein